MGASRRSSHTISRSNITSRKSSNTTSRSPITSRRNTRLRSRITAGMASNSLTIRTIAATNHNLVPAAQAGTSAS